MLKSNRCSKGEGVLGFTDMWAIGIGQVIGAGVITLIGPAIAMTGASVWVAYIAAILLGAITIFPIIIFSSVTKYSGGDYSVISTLGGERLGGMYIVGFFMQMLGMSIFVTALGMYTESLYPNISGKLCGITILIILYAINLLGVANMARFQKIMSALLIATLLMFIMVGITKGDFSQSLSFGKKDFFSGGFKGFMNAMMLLVYSCQGYKYNVNYGGQAKNPTKTIPYSMLAVIPVLIVAYAGVALIDASVLPLSEVAGKPLTLAAKAILSNKLFYIFIFGGPITALITTMNSNFSAMVGPFSRAAKDGWFPEGLARTNSRGAATVILTIQLIVGLVPVILGFSVNIIVNNFMLVTSVYQFMIFYSLSQVPKKMPDKWRKSVFYCSNPVYYSVLIIASAAQLLILAYSLKNLTVELALFNLFALMICFIYAIIRYNSGKTHVNTEDMVELS
jgi:APA family basic amino acid/polyamine antiporter